MFTIVYYFFFQLTLKMILINGCVAWISCIKRSWVLPHLRSQRGTWAYFHCETGNWKRKIWMNFLRCNKWCLPVTRWTLSSWCMILKAHMEILNVCFTTYVLRSHSLLHTLMGTCNSHCSLHPKQNLFMRSQEQLVFVCWLLGKFKSQPYEGETAPLSFRGCCVWNCSCSDCQFCGQGFSDVSIPHSFSSLLAFLFVATALSCCEVMVCPCLLPDQIVALTLMLSNRSNACWHWRSA